MSNQTDHQIIQLQNALEDAACDFEKLAALLFAAHRLVCADELPKAMSLLMGGADLAHSFQQKYTKASGADGEAQS